MSIITWDEVGKRNYELGLDRGVLYLPGCIAVPWNGLISIVEHFENESSPVYYEGKKINQLVALGDFSGTMTALTYPDEFLEVEGLGKIRPGVFVGDQKPKTFGLSYRTQLGNDVDGYDSGYKLHILYNLMAVPSDTTFTTISDQLSVNEFEWSITAIPEEISGMRPTAHLIIDSREVNSVILKGIETILYGDSNPGTITFTDNGDGSWTAVAENDEDIRMFTDDAFEIVDVNATYLNDYTFVVSDGILQACLIPIQDVIEYIRSIYGIQIINNGDGTWTAISENDADIQMLTANEAEITNADVNYLDSNTYVISSSY